MKISIPSNMSKEELDRYRSQTHLVLAAIEDLKGELQQDFGEFFKTEVMITGRVLLIPEGASDENDWFCCYLSDRSADARLVVDDYIAEFVPPGSPEAPTTP